MHVLPMSMWVSFYLLKTMPGGGLAMPNCPWRECVCIESTIVFRVDSCLVDRLQILFNPDNNKAVTE